MEKQIIQLIHHYFLMLQLLFYGDKEQKTSNF